MRYLTTVLVLILFFTACQSGKKTKLQRPAIFLTETQMVELITDVQLLEAAINNKRNLGQSINEIKPLWYNQLFEKHQITDIIFEKNMAYYNEKPALMEQILEEVLANIIQQQAQLKVVNPESGGD